MMIAVIRGRGQFPIDMLRFDMCYPFRPEDSQGIIDTFATPHAWAIVVETRNPRGFELARWDSFSCKCEVRV